MSLTESWRRLNFFDKNAVLDPKTGERFNGLAKLQMCCWATTSDGQGVFMGESTGALFALNRTWEQTYWKAYLCTLSDVASVGHHVLTIGEDEKEINSLLKIWEQPEFADDSQESDCCPKLLKTIRLSQLGPAGISTRATTITGHSSGRMIAAGYEDGSVFGYIGDYLKDRVSSPKNWIRIRESAPVEGEVTGTAISILKNENIVMFVLTNKSLMSYVIDAKGTIINKLRHEALGSTRDCWTFSESSNQFTVANRDMVHLYDAESCQDAEGARGKCYALGRGLEKQQIASCGEFLAVLTKMPALIPTPEMEWMTVVTVYDVSGKYVAFTCSLPSLANCFVLDGVLMLLAHDGQLSSLAEKHLNAKLDILYKKSFFDVAIDVARRSEGGMEVLPHIHAKYGDFYYGKADFGNAMREYKESIGVLDPSYVIKKFLDGSKMTHLCSYLETLRKKGKSNLHHTTILVNCYARLNQREKLQSLLAGLEQEPNKQEAEAVVTCLRESKLLNEATLFAMKSGLHDAALSIMVDDQGKYAQAIKYIAKFSPEKAVHYIENYGRRLLVANTSETIAMLEDMLLRSDGDENVNVSLLLQLFMGVEECGLPLMEELAGRDGAPPPLTTTVIELNMRAYDKEIPFDVHDKVLRYVTRENEEKVRRMAEELKCDPVVEALLRRSKDLQALHAFYMRRARVEDVVELAVEMNTSRSWLDTLAFVSKMEETVTDEIMEKILEKVKQTNCVHPLVVLEMLSKSTRLNVAAVKKYIVEWLKEQRDGIAADKEAITHCEQRIQEVGKQIDNLNFNTQILQVSKCCACDFALQLPSIFFLCRHAFHVHCFDSYADKPDVCPKCSVETAKAGAARMDSDLSIFSRNAYGEFADRMNKASDSIEIISKYISSGLFDTKKSNGPSVPTLSPSSSTASSTRSPFHQTPSAGSIDTRRPTVIHSSTNPFETSSTNPFDEPKNPFD